MKKLTKLVNESSQAERPFFLFMTIILAGMYVYVLISTPELRQPGIFILYTILMMSTDHVFQLLLLFVEEALMPLDGLSRLPV